MIKEQKEMCKKNDKKNVLIKEFQDQVNQYSETQRKYEQIFDDL